MICVSFWSKSKALGGDAKSKNRHPSWLYSAVVGLSRSSHSELFFKIGVLKHFTNFTGKHLCWSLFLKRSLKVFKRRDSNKGLFLWTLQKFKTTYFVKHLRRLLFYCFKDFLLHGPKSSRSRLYDGVNDGPTHQGPSHRSSLLFLSRHVSSLTKSWSAF